jgi:TRAP-type transport system periplasmic protein
MNRTLVALMAPAAIAIATITLPLSASAQTKLVLGTIQAPASPESKSAETFAQEVSKRTEGRYQVNVVPGSQLGPAAEQIQNVRTGAQDLFIDDISWNAQLVKDYAVLAVPFAINGSAGFSKVMDSAVGQEWRDRLTKEFGLTTLSDRFMRSPRVVFTTKKVASVGDMTNMKFRVPEIDVYFNSWKAIGVNPTPVPWGELYLAIRQGVVDGGEGPFTTLLPTKFPETAKFVLETNHLYSANTMMMNAKKFDAMSDADKKHFRDAANAAADSYTKQVAALEAEHRETMKTKFAVTLASPTPEQRAGFQAAVAKAVPEFEKKGLWPAGVYEKVVGAQK